MSLNQMENLCPKASVNNVSNNRATVRAKFVEGERSEVEEQSGCCWFVGYYKVSSPAFFSPS